MVITATDFQLRVNEYFTKIVQGEEVIIERYGKKFAVLVPFERYEEEQKKLNNLATQKQDIEVDPMREKPAAVQKFTQIEEPTQTVSPAAEKIQAGANLGDTLTQGELVRLIRALLNA